MLRRLLPALLAAFAACTAERAPDEPAGAPLPAQLAAAGPERVEPPGRA